MSTHFLTVVGESVKIVLSRPHGGVMQPTEFFKALVEESLQRQHVQASEMTSYYLVDLLCRFVRPDCTPFYEPQGEALAFRLKRALESGGLEQRARLRNLGDASLFMCGFFSDSLRRSAMDVDYYVSMGEYAYGSLSRHDQDAFGEVFAELHRRFVPFMDVLAEISEQSGIPTDTTTMRIYERYLRTGSPRDAQLLAERGIAPNASVGKKFLQ